MDEFEAEDGLRLPRRAEVEIREIIARIEGADVTDLPYLPRLLRDEYPLDPRAQEIYEARILPVIAGRIAAAAEAAAAQEAREQEEWDIQEATRRSLQEQKPPPAPRRVVPTPHVVTKEEAEREEQCMICINKIPLGAKDIVAVKCGHLFHGKCLTGWVEQHDTCPLCRADIGE